MNDKELKLMNDAFDLGLAFVSLEFGNGNGEEEDNDEGDNDKEPHGSDGNEGNLTLDLEEYRTSSLIPSELIRTMSNGKKNISITSS
jgi:hypothetical protein